MFPNQKFCKNALLHSTSFSPFTKWQKFLDIAEHLNVSKQSKGLFSKRRGLKIELSITPLLAGLLAACGGGGGGGGGTSNVTTPDDIIPDPLGFDFYVLDGAIEGARVYVDENRNGQRDDGDTFIGTTDTNGIVRVGPDYAGETFLVDVEGALDVFTGERLPADSILYRARSDERGGVDVVASPVSTLIEVLREDVPTRTDTDILEMIFGAGTQVEIDDLSNPDNFILPPEGTPIVDDSPEAIAEKIALTSIRLQVLIEQESGNLDTILDVVTDDDGFDVADLTPTSQRVASDRIIEARERAGGKPVAIPAINVEVNEDNDLTLGDDVWGFRDPAGNADGDSAFTRLDIVSITDGNTSAVRGVLVASDGTEYGAGDEIPATHLETLIFRPVADYFGRVEIAFRVFDREALADVATLAITVNGINDAPVFTSSATASVNENIAANDDGDTQGSAATIYTAIAAPDDAGDTVSYSLTSANDGDSFGINASTGTVWFRAAPDHENKSSYSFTVVASVTADGVTQTATRIVTLSVTDLNDNAPVFTSSATASVNENIAANDDGDTQGSAATIYTAIAAPDDAGDTVSYSLTSANDGDSFGINASTGTVWFRAAPDHENKSSYSFTVVASVTADGVTHSASQIITLSVTDLNDNAPVFTSSATASVNENIAVNDDGDTQGSAATIYTAIAAPDDAGDTVSYSLTSANDGDSFGINASTGTVWFRSPPDHENKSSYSFTVVASVTADGVTQTATRIVTLSVTDLNDNAPVFTSSATASVNENIAANDDGDTQGSAATIYTAIAAPDDAGDTVSYSLTSANDGDSFGINASTGTVWFRAAPDHENKSSYSFTVVASVTADGVTQTATRIVTLSVTDLNDNAPVFTSSATASVNENITANDDGDTQGSAATIYTAIAAPDDAGDTVSYSLTSANDGDSFGINASTGDVWFRAAPDHENKSSYSFTVVASVTADGVTQTATRIVTLSVTDLNDNAPVFTSSATASVNENIAANDDGDTQGSAATIYTAIAAPDDAGDTVSYSLTSANDGDSFGINASTGTVWLRVAPDFETKSSYSFTVVASVTADGVTHSESQIITLSVTDLNDNAPVFTSSATASVNENIAANDDGDTQGSAATIYTAIAAPDDAGDTVSYSLTSANDGDSFGINASTGDVWFRAAPDHENKSSYSFTVVASVTADGVTQTATRIVTLSVTDLNDNAPVFTSSATASVNENIAANDDGDTQGSAATIYTAIAAPDDAGDTVSYSLTSANDGDSFGINASTGDVWFRAAPDHENKSSYSFTVVASVTADGVTQTATRIVTLSVTDLNDNAPVFTSSATASVNENITANDDGDTQGSAATIYTAIAAPDDAGDTVSYSLTSANDGDSFGINASTGDVWFRAAPDHENKSSYSFTVVASVTADGVTQTATRIVTLSVTDLNDNAPVFTSSATASVNENIAANDDGDTQGSAATIYTAIAAPDDAGDTVSYSLTSANDGDSFGINASTGTVWFRAAPDFETKSSYSFTVVASVTADGVTQTATRIVTLSITDLNDNAPVFTSSATASVNENIAANDDGDTQGSAATIYTAIAAPDDAGDTVSYSLTSANDGDSFGINASTGDVWFRAAPDHENKSSYSFTVVASVTADGVTHSASQIITLSVTDLNDNAPVFTSSATASVNENIAANDSEDTQGSAATIYTAIAAPDDAGDTVSYSLTSANDGDSFGINASTGTVWFRAAPDHENKSSYSFTVVASVTADGVTQTATRIVTLSVTDLNDNAPVFTSSATASVNENIAANDDGDTQGSAATIYTAIAAPDDAGDTVSYSLTSANDGDSFGINASTGTVWFRAAPDHENKSSYSFTVVASVTADGVTQTATRIVTLSVTDLNDNAPVFTSSATASVNENIAANDDGDTQGSAATIYTAIAAPDDAGDTVSYSLTSANDGDSFGINASTGTVWLRSPPDHENKSSYSFTVVASVTADGVTQTATRIVTLSVTDLNDNAPVFTSSATASVNENIAVNDDGDTQGSAATIYTAIAAPDDAGDTVSYSLTSANDGDSFGINASTGTVWLRSPPDHENKSSYSFTVVASVTADGVTQTATRIVTLSVTDLNDNAPVFTSSATASVNENVAVNDDGDTQGSAATIYTAIAAPDDAGDTVSYSLTSANDGDSFGINASTGDVWFRAAPDHENKSSYSFTVVASVTADGVTHSATRIVTLSTTDLNDNAPVFTSSATASVNENIAVNDDGDTQGSAATIYTAIAAPDDAGDTVIYSLTSANDGDSFGINASTGTVWLRSPPDHENKTSYSFTVVASVTADGVTHSASQIITLSVTDLNDNAPVFTSSATASVNENIAANDDGDTQGSAATIYTAIAAPDDAGDTVSYSLTSANDGDSFGINASTGTVWLRAAPDHENKSSYSFTVVASVTADGVTQTATRIVTLSVTDLNDNAPVFTSSATASVNENIAVNDDGDTQGSAATIYTAIAAPDDAGDTVIYSLTSANDGDSFGINASTGTVWLRAAPDHENKSSYSFTVVASVTADGVTQTATRIVTLSVTDLNDNAPVFTSSATASVNENIAVNDDGDTQGSAATIYTAIAAPDDAGDTVIYSLTSANDGDSFGINASTGTVWLRVAPDFETKSSYSFTVVASVTADGVTQTATRIVTLSVTDLNDNAPVFTSSATASVNENIAVNDDGDTQGSAATIYTAIAAPDDAGDTVSYSLTSANDGDSFGINASTGTVWLRSPPDHENKSSYSFTVVASVTADGVTHSASQIITLNVTDLNDNAPVFTSSATASVNENIAVNDDGDTQGSAATIYTAIAAPDDAGDTVSYSLTSANDGDSFGINASTGDVWFRAAPDFETKSSYSFTVVASVTADGVTHSESQIITLSVTDLNDNAPVFTSSATASVNENITANDDGDTQGSAATIYTAIAAPDDAGDTVSYSLTSANDGDSFGINASTGTVWLRSPPDHENKSSYSFTVVASVTADGVTQTATRIVTLSVTDLNDNAPVFTSSATASVNENITANDSEDTQGSAATIYTAIAAPDDAGDTVSYSLTSANDGDSFGINASTGDVWFRAAPDHENKSSYSFTVVASVTADGVTQTATRFVTLSITDLNDNAPVFTSSATASVNENIAVNDDGDTQGSAATIYTAIAAPDDAGDTVSYSLTSANDGDSFGINASTGTVWLRSPPDHENKSSYSFTVVASVTADGVTHSASQIITLSVTDLNDNAPVFTSSATASVNENIAANDDGDTQGSAATIYTAIAAPDDAGDTVSYSLTSANDGDSFGINASTGTVWLRVAPDFETKSSYSFTVVASVTADGVTQTATRIVTLSVTDLNDNAPVFTSSATASVNENIAANDSEDTQGSAATIYTAIAAPDDAGDTVSYSLTSANDGDSFGINASTGDVWFRAAPDHENKSSYSFTVVASVTADGVTHSESQIITLSVTDLNDNAPVFTSSATASVNENIAANDDGDTQGSAATIYTAIAAPDDAGDTVSYSLTSANDGDSFGINASTGTVWFRAAPDHENKSSYSFTVVASVTADGVTQTATRIVTLSVTDLNDNAPVFTSSATASVNENIAANDSEDTQGSAATIYTAIATPDDAGDTVSYSLTSANDGDSFGINASTGTVWFRAAPDHENKSSYSFTVVASVTADGVTHSASQIITLSVTDLNDNAPVFTSSATASVNENIAVNDDGDTQGSAATIYTAIAAPDDAGDTVIYSLTSANDGDSFGINASTGTVWFRAAPDHENKSSYLFRVVASVTADGVTQTATRIVTLSVTDLNDNAPVFTSSATASVNENITANDDGDTQGSAATIYTAIAAPDDAGDTVSYSLTSANDGDSFGINASTGDVWFRAAPDHENKSSYSFTVVASVTADGVTQTATRIVTLSVTDLNDNAPVFTSSATASVNENIAVNDDGDTQGSAATIYTAIAAPDDAGDTVIYSLTSANDGDSFGINASTGTVWLRSPPDHENKSSYSFTVVASVTADGVTQTATRIVTLSVTDLNDNAPVIITNSGEDYTIEVDENTTTVIDIEASDVDAGDTLKYSLAGGDDVGAFDIDEGTGVVTWKVAPDFENPTDSDDAADDDDDPENTYNVRVAVTDAAGASDTIDLTITVTNVNEAPSLDEPLSDDDANTDLSVTESGVGTSGDFSANGGLVFGDEDGDDTVVTLKVFVGNEDATIGNITDEIGHDANDNTIVMINGDARNSDGTAYGNFVFTRAADGTVSWTYELDDGAVEGLGEGDTATDSVWVRVQDDDANSPVRQITVTITGTEDPLAFNLYVLDGTIEGALVYVDENDNGEIDANETPIGTTDENGRVSIEAEYAGETFLIDASGARDLFTGESLPSDTFYRAISDERGGSDVVASPISTLIEALKDSDPELTDEAILEIIFGANTRVEMDDLNNPDNFILPTDADSEAIAEQIASTSIQLQILTEEKRGDLSAVITAVTDDDGFVVTDDLTLTSQREATARINEARQRAAGEPIANPINGLEINEDSSLTLDADVWGFRDPVGNTDDIRSSFARLDIVSITNGGLMASDGTEYGAGGKIPSEHFENLVFRPAADYFGRIEIVFKVFDGEAFADEATLAITVNGINDAPVIDTTGVETQFSIDENTTANVIEITATDVEGDTLSYSLGGLDADDFRISDAGVVTWATSPDFETPTDSDGDNIYNVTVMVTDNAGVPATAMIALTITVTNVNEAPVLMPNDTVTPMITENTAVITDTGRTFTPTDAEGATFTAGSFTVYEGSETTASKRFDVVLDNGVYRLVLLANQPTDFETESRIRLRVKVNDGSADGGVDSKDVNVTVNVANVNDNTPTLTASSMTGTITENIATQTDTGVTLTPADLDGVTFDADSFIVYEGTSGTADTDISTRFGVVLDGTDYKLVLLKGNALNHEESEAGLSIGLRVRVSDGSRDGSRVSEDVNITVAVTDANDAPVLTPGGTVTSIAENTSDETDTGRTFTVSDVDGATFTETNFTVYEGGGTTALDISTRFDVIFDGTDYKLILEAGKDILVTESPITLHVKVSDGGRDSAPVEVTVAVMDVNDAPILDNPHIPRVDLTLFDTIILTPKAGQTPYGVRFVADNSLPVLTTGKSELALSVDPNDSNINIIRHHGARTKSFNLEELGASFWNNNPNSLYTAQVTSEFNGDTEIVEDDFLGMFFGIALAEFSVHLGDDEVDAVLTATGVLNFGDVDADDTLLNLKVFVGNEDETVAEINMDIGVGDSRDVINDYGTFKFTRAADGTVSWAYTLNENAANALGAGNTATDSVWLRVQDDDDANSPVRQITVLITGKDNNNEAPTLDDPSTVSHTAEVLTLFDAITLTPKTGQTPFGVRFVEDDSLVQNVDGRYELTLSVDADNITEIKHHSTMASFFAINLRSLFNDTDASLYTAELTASLFTQIQYAKFFNTSFGVPTRADFSVHPSADGIDADTSAGGVLNFADAETSLTSLQVFIGNTDATIANITEEIVHNASAETTKTIVGKGESDDIANGDYGNFTFTRATDGTVSWTYELNENAVNALTAGQTATDSVWLRVQDDDDANSPVRQITVLITGKDNNNNEAPTLDDPSTVSHTAEVLTLFDAITLTPKTGQTPFGVRFVEDDSLVQNVDGRYELTLSVDADNITEIKHHSTMASFFAINLRSLFNDTDASLYTAELTASLFTQIQYAKFFNTSFGVPTRADFSVHPSADGIDADTSAAGDINFADAETSLTSLQVFIGNTDATIANITEEIVHNASAETTKTIVGKGESDDIANGDYGNFTFTRATDGTVSWTYKLDDDAAKGLEKGETATDSVWIRVNDGSLDSPVQKITVLITGVNEAPTLDDPSTVSDTAEVLTLFDAITLTPKTGQTPSGVRFVVDDDLSQYGARVSVDPNDSNINIFEYNSSVGFFYFYELRDAFANSPHSLYKVEAINGTHDTTQINQSDFEGEFFGVSTRVDFSVHPSADGIDADTSAGGVLNFGDAETSLTSLQVFIGNTDATIANITEEIVHNASAETTKTIVGKGESDDIANGDYGNFTFTRATDGTVSWAYTLTENAVNALTAGQTATDSVWLRVYDGSLDSPVRQITVLITGTRTDPNAVPVISNADDQDLSFDENTIENVITIAATDADGDTLTYSLGGTDADDFNINETTGVVTWAQTPNYDDPTDSNKDNTYNVTVTATDDASVPATAIISLTINVNDTGDSSVFRSSDRALVSEDIKVSGSEAFAEVFYTAEVVPDVTNPLVIYSLSDDSNGLFGINPTTGAVWFRSPQDAEVRTSQTFTVRATIKGGLVDEVLDRIVTVTINVAYVNKPPILILLDTFNTDLRALEMGLQPEVITLHGLEFTLKDEEASYGIQFRTSSNNTTYIENDVVYLGKNNTSGFTRHFIRARFNDENKYENETSYRAEYAENASGDGRVTIATFVNGGDGNGFYAPPVPTTEVPRNRASGGFNITDETSMEDLRIFIGNKDDNVANITTELGVSESLTLVGNGKFGSITGTTYGQFVFTRAADGEVRWSYTLNEDAADELDEGDRAIDSVWVWVQDGDNLSSSVGVIPVGVYGSNDAPVITTNEGDSHSLDIIDGTAGDVVTIAASDVDNGDAETLKYSLGGTDADDFNINETTGVVTWKTNTPPDYNAPTDSDGDNIYNVTVTVTDDNLGMDTIALTINVSAGADAPTLTSGGTVTPIAENTSLRTDTGLTFTPADTDGNALTTNIFTVYEGSSGSTIVSPRFEVIEDNTGVFRLVLMAGQRIDYETEAEITLRVKVNSGPDNGNSRLVTVKIPVTDVGDAPTLTLDKTDLLVTESGVVATAFTIAGVELTLKNGATPTGIEFIAVNDGAFRIDATDVIYVNENHPGLKLKTIVQRFNERFKDNTNYEAALVEAGTGEDTVLLTVFLNGEDGRNGFFAPPAPTEVAADVSANGTLVLSDDDEGDTLLNLIVFVGDTNDPATALSLNSSSDAITTGYGSFTFTRSATEVTWSYTLIDSAADELGAGEVATDSVWVRVSDGNLDSPVQQITVLINGTNDTPTANAGGVGYVIIGTVTKDTPGETATGEFIATDADANDTLSYSVPTQGTYGTLTLSTNGAWTYALDNTNATIDALVGGASETDMITLRATDRDGAYVERNVTITINGRTDVNGTDAGDSLGDATATLSQTIQGGNLDDTLVAGSGGDVLIGGAGTDNITLGTGKDTIGYRIASTASALVGSDGRDTINGFVVDVDNALSEDKFVFVDTDATPLENFADLIALAKGDTAQLIVRLLKTGADYSGFEFTFTGGDDNDANDVSLTINLDTILGGSSVVQGDKYFGNGGIDTANDQLTDTGLDNFVTNFSDNFEVLSDDTFGIEIL